MTGEAEGYDKPAAVETAAGRVCLHIGAEAVAIPEETNDARVKNVRKAESMRTTTAEPLAVPEKKMRSADGVVSVENEDGPANKTAATSRPSNWETLSKSQKGNWRKRNQ